MAAGDLTTLEHAKEFLAGQSPVDTKDDAVIRRLIATFSAKFKLETGGRAIIRGTFTDTKIGDGGTRLSLEQYPVAAVTSVKVDGTTIAQRPAIGSDGWVLRDDGVDLYGYAFTKGAEVEVIYTAGYQVSGEARTIPAAAPYEIQADELFKSDIGVTIASAAGTKVSVSPAAGQYAVSAAGLYTFAAADASKAVLLSYAHVPADIEQAVIGRVALAFRERPNIGTAMATGGGEMVDFRAATFPVLAVWNDVVAAYRRLVVG